LTLTNKNSNPTYKLIDCVGCWELMHASITHFQKPDLFNNETSLGWKGKNMNYYWKGVVKNLDTKLEWFKLLQDVEE
jgi:hypothetical protein